ncbi:hypothetical protein [Streptomyces sp. NPDC002952]|uniref:hypothetical protein n=1 Tax=Streptomyces sp. NPDC002952 TaxID=3364673 RepID=UPI00368091BA
MADETGKGAWMMRTTVDNEGKSSGWERYWDPDVTPLSEAEADVRYRRILDILFSPRPDDD